MFYPFDLFIEISKLESRFQSHRLSIITKIMTEFQTPEIRIMFAQLLCDINVNVKNIDDVVQTKDRASIREIVLQIENEVFNKLFSVMALIMSYLGINFAQQYDRMYWEHMASFVEQLWKAMPEDKKVLGTKRGFKHLFEEFHDDVVKKYPTLFVKQLSEVGKMYRCRKWSVNDDYELMIPDERFVKDNRWNPDGVAYLYMACGDSTESYDGTVNMVQKTCFEEIRLSDGMDVAVCEFIALKKSIKIIDLCYEGVDLSQLSRELQVPPSNYQSIVKDALIQRPQLAHRMIRLAQKTNRDGFIKKAGPALKGLMNEIGLNEKVEQIVYSRTSTILLGLIDESIFKVVDKDDDPELKAYLPFRTFSLWLIDKGYDGIIYRSTRMNKVGLRGKNIVLFNKKHATYKEGTMRKYTYSSGKYIEWT